MSVLVGLSFVDEAILVSDSRLSFEKGIKPPKDELRKVYQIGPTLSVGFTSEDVAFTLELLKRLTRYSIEKAKHKTTLYLLGRLPKVAKYEYSKIAKTRGCRKNPTMEIIFSGVIKDRGYRITKGELLNCLDLSSGSANLPPQIAVNILKMNNGWIPVAPPSTVITKQVFPSGNVKPPKSLGIIVSGTGSSILEHLVVNYKNMFSTVSNMRYVIIKNCFESFYKESGVNTIGGLIQILSIKTTGVSPVSYSENIMGKDGCFNEISSVKFKEREWIGKDKNGKIIKVKQNPLI